MRAPTALLCGTLFVASCGRPDAPTESVHLALEPPAGWVETEVSAPELSQAPDVTLTEWRALGRQGHAKLVAACVRTPVSSWSPELEPVALERVAALASSTALRLFDVGVSAGAVERRGHVLEQALTASAGAVLGRSWLAFSGSHANGCFLLCADAACATCGASLGGPITAPPSTGAALRALLFLVHHPRETVLFALLLTAIAFGLVVATRPRPTRRREALRRRCAR